MKTKLRVKYLGIKNNKVRVKIIYNPKDEYYKLFYLD